MIFILNEQNSLKKKITHQLYDDFDVIKTMSFETMYHV